MVVTNPTDQDITVSIKGNEYFVAANSSISGVKESHADYWKNMLHNFIEVSPEKAPKVETPKVEVKDVIEVAKEDEKKVVKK
jgi:hypothetical protein